jgi:hypothetical protein
MSIKVNYPRTSQTQVYNVFVNQSSAKNHASPSLPLFLIVSFKCSKQAQCRHRFQAVMLFAVPPSSSLAAFFVLQGASLISASFHSAVRKLTTLNFIPPEPVPSLSRDSFQPPAVQRLLLILARLRVAAGCGLSGDEVTIFN